MQSFKFVNYFEDQLVSFIQSGPAFSPHSVHHCGSWSGYVSWGGRKTDTECSERYWLQETGKNEPVTFHIHPR